jgi:hypothetical protein
VQQRSFEPVRIRLDGVDVDVDVERRDWIE